MRGKPRDASVAIAHGDTVWYELPNASLVRSIFKPSYQWRWVKPRHLNCVERGDLKLLLEGLSLYASTRIICIWTTANANQAK